MTAVGANLLSWHHRLTRMCGKQLVLAKDFCALVQRGGGTDGALFYPIASALLANHRARQSMARSICHTPVLINVFDDALFLSCSSSSHPRLSRKLLASGACRPTAEGVPCATQACRQGPSA